MSKIVIGFGIIISIIIVVAMVLGWLLWSARQSLAHDEQPCGMLGELAKAEAARLST